MDPVLPHHYISHITKNFNTLEKRQNKVKTVHF